MENKFSKKQKEIKRSIPSPSDKCDFQGCNNDTLVVITIVRDCSGNTRSGSFSDFGNTNTNALRDGYTFIRFITRCAECYQADMNRGTAGSLL